MSGQKFYAPVILFFWRIAKWLFLGVTDIIDKNWLRTINEPWYCSKTTSKMDNSRWMANLDDSTLITEVIIPGTHDSASDDGGEFAKCQTLSVKEQLKIGIRFFDFRCKPVNDELEVYHGILDLQNLLCEVFKHIRQFLRDNPSEFIIARIRQEGKPFFCDKSFDQIYTEHAKAAEEFMVKGAHKVITVKEARGKILILKNFEGKGTGNEWELEDQCQQDLFEPSGVEEKWEKVETHFLKNCARRDRLSLNFLSACTPKKIYFPRYFARKINKKIYEMLNQTKEKDMTGGIIIMDFPGPGLIKKIIEYNN